MIYSFLIDMVEQEAPGVRTLAFLGVEKGGVTFLLNSLTVVWKEECDEDP